MSQARGPYDIVVLLVTVGVLVVIMAVCLIPVVVLYWLFESQNFFELTGFWKGMVASGPIAAYAFLFWLSLRFYRDLRRDELMPEAETRRLGIASPQDLGGTTWTGTWGWTDEDGNPQSSTETVVIGEQRGRVITGTITDQEGLDAKFRGEIYNDVVTLYYVSSKENRLSCGSLTVELSRNRSSMQGQQVFYDIVSDELATTPYQMQKQG